MRVGPLAFERQSEEHQGRERADHVVGIRPAHQMASEVMDRILEGAKRSDADDHIGGGEAGRRDTTTGPIALRP